MKKIGLSALALVLAFLLQISTFTPLLSAQAEGEAPNDLSPYITQVTLSVKDAAGAIVQTITLPPDGGGSVPELEIHDSDTVSLKYTFSFPNDGEDVTVARPGTYQTTVPSVFSVPAGGLSGDLSSGDGTYRFDAGEASITLNNNVTGKSDVGGEFFAALTFHKEALPDDNKITFQIGGNDVTVPVHVITPPPVDDPPKIEKDYVSAGSTKDRLNWKIKVSAPKNSGLTNATVTDSLSDNQTLDKGSVYVGSTQLTENATPGFSVGTDGTITFSLGNMAAGASQTVTYSTVPKSNVFNFPNTSAAFENTAELDSEEITNPLTDTANTTVKVDWIDKSGKADETDPGKINWTVKLNPENQSLSGPFTVTDTLPSKYLTLVENDPASHPIQLGTASVPKDSAGSGNVYYTVENVTVNGEARQKITFHFLEGYSTDTAQDLSFSTEVDPSYYNGNHGSFVNTAEINDGTGNKVGEDNGGGQGVGTGSSVIRKDSAGSYDSAARLLTWNVTVNENKIAIQNPVVTDTIDAHQEFYDGGNPGSAIVITSGPGAETAVPLKTADTQEKPYYTVSADRRTVTISLPDYRAGEGPTVLQYKTEVTDPDYYAANGASSVRNDARLTGQSSSTGAIDESDWEDQPVVSKVIEKKGNRDFNPDTKELSWTVTVNQNKMDMTNAVVTDTLPDDLKLDDSGNVEVGKVSVNGAAITTDSGSTPYYTVSGQTLTFHLGDISRTEGDSAQKTILFSTTVTDEILKNHAGDFTLTNKASLKIDDDDAKAVEVTGDNPIDHSIIEKGGAQAEEGGQKIPSINWHVVINKNEIPGDVLYPEVENSSSVSVSDSLKPGLALDLTSLSLKQLKWDADQKKMVVDETATAAIPALTSANIKYEPNPEQEGGHIFTFTFPADLDLKKAYQLDFATDITDTSVTSFTNSVSLNGTTGSSGSSEDSNVTVSHQSGGTAWGSTRGSVTVRKTDSADGALLSGAVFDLFYGGQSMDRQRATGADGTVSFNGLKFGTVYTVKEVTAPANHENSGKEFTFKLVKTDGATQIQLLNPDGSPSGDPVGSLPDVTNVRKVGTIKFIKTGDGDAPLAGATFRLCDTDNTPLPAYGAVTTGQNGSVTFADVPYGSYHIVETNVPEGYLPLVIPVTLDDSNSGIVTVGADHLLNLGDRRNQPAGSITVTKKAAEYEGAAETALPGATFQILDGSNQPVGESKQTDANGAVTFSELPAGSYTLREVSAPAGYQTIADYPFVIGGLDSTVEQRTLTYTATDYKKLGSVSFTKTDADTGANLSGAKFALYHDEAGTSPVRNAAGEINAQSGADGVVTFTDVPYGSYFIKETQPPADYDPLTASIAVTVNGDSIVIPSETVENHRSLGAIQLTKTDSANGNPLQGAVFVLKDSLGNQIGQPQTSDENGLVKFENVPYGDGYVITETSSPADYDPLNDSVSVDLHSPLVTVETAEVANTRSRGVIQLTKTDSANGNPLQGAVFVLKDSLGNQIGQPQTSDENGLVKFENVPYGDGYTVTETAAPADYDLLSGPVSVNLHAALYLIDTEAAANDRSLGTIQFTKNGADGALAGAEFALYESDGTTAVKDGEGNPITAVSDEAGLVKFTDVPYGDYVIKETKAPADYILSGAAIEAKLHGEDDHAVLTLDPATNEKKTGTIQFTKNGADGTLAGAEFALYESDGTTAVTDGDGNPLTAVSDEAGLVKFTDVPYGDYVIKETKAPADYILSGAAIEAKLHSEDDHAVLTLDPATNEKKTGTIQFTKNGADGALAGAEFALYESDGTTAVKDGEGNPITAVSDEAGLVKFTDVPYGDYVIKETKAPADYILSGAAIEAKLHGEDDHVVLTLDPATNEKKTGTIQFTKNGADGALAGAEFALYESDGTTAATDGDGNPITAVSDEAGLVKFTDVPYGDYVIKETKAPYGYLLSSAAIPGALHDAEANGAELVLGPVANEKYFGAVSVKKTDVSGSPLAGAEFTLYDADGAAVASASSGLDGIVKFENLPAGSYTVRETKAPAGYRLGADAIAFEVTENTYSAVQSFTVKNERIPEKPAPNPNENQNGGTPSPNAPQTGDGALPVLPTAMLLLSLGGIAFSRRATRRRNYHS